MLLTARLAMNISIQFNPQQSLRTVEIENVRPDRVLPPEPSSTDTAIAQALP
jgi:hypothetical protein